MEMFFLEPQLFRVKKMQFFAPKGRKKNKTKKKLSLKSM